MNEFMLQGFNLQLFNEEGEVPSANTETTVQAETPTTNYEYAIQDTGSGRKLVRVPQETKQETPAVSTEPQTEPQAQQQPQTEPKTETTPVIPYTAEELADAEDITKLDESRVPSDLKPIYKNMVRGMNRKFQEMAAERKALKEMTDVLKQSAPQAPQTPNPKDFFVKQHQEIVAEVQELFGGEEYEPLFHPEHQLAYNQILQRKAFEAQQRQTQQQQAQSRQQKVSAVVNELKAIPDMQEVIMFAHDNLPAKEWEEGERLLQSGEKDKVMAKFKEWRDKKYGVKKPTEQPAKPKPKPPVLEGAGKGNETPQQVSLSGEFLGKFRNASPTDKIKMISQWRTSQK